MYAAYSFGLALLCLLAAPYFLWKGHGTGRYVSNLGERLGRLAPDLNPGGRPSIWVHAVSVGEVLASRGLLAALKERLPERPLLLSTTTATGQAIARRGLAGVDGVFYVPFDLPGPVRRALDAVNPTVLVLVETEIWPNLVHEAHRRGVRVAIVNGRLSERSFAGYRRVRNLLRRVLGEIDLFLMQGEAHARRMLALGAPPERVRVSGNLKFDAAGAPSPAPELAAVLSSEGRRLWVAGSTMPGEEEMVLRAYREVQARVPDAALVVAPRHPERFAEIPAVVEAAGFRCEARTRLEPGTWRNGTVVLLDTLGELAQVYPLASVVF
ncbi:MAG TPA: glycosyltransferase N-terminal domain-containing protein, partial [Vicinamibacteria bacterium]